MFMEQPFSPPSDDLASSVCDNSPSSVGTSNHNLLDMPALPSPVISSASGNNGSSVANTKISKKNSTSSIKANNANGNMLSSEVIANNIKLNNIQDYQDLYAHVKGTPSRYRVLKEARFVQWLPLVLVTALQDQEMPIVHYLLEKVKLEPTDPIYVRVAAEYGFQMGIKNLLARKAPVDTWALVLACGNGHLDVVKYLIEKKSPVSPNALIYASEGGHFAVVKFLLEKRLVMIDDSVWRVAIRRGHINLVRYFMMETLNMLNNSANHHPGHAMLQFPPSWIEIAAEEGHLEILDFLFKKGVPLSSTAFSLACQMGRVPTVSYLLDKNCPIDTFAVTMAILNKHFEIVKMLLTSGRAPLDKRAIVAAEFTNNQKLVDLITHLHDKQVLNQNGSTSHPGQSLTPTPANLSSSLGNLL